MPTGAPNFGRSSQTEVCAIIVEPMKNVVKRKKMNRASRRREFSMGPPAGSFEWQISANTCVAEFTLDETNIVNAGRGTGPGELRSQ